MKKLTEQQYWKWRFLAQKMNHEQAVLENLKLMGKLQASELFNKMNHQNRKCDSSKSEYHLYLAELENILGCTLKNTAIDETTLEVRPLDEPNNNKGEN